MAITVEAVVTNEVGLHARPAAVFVQTANTFKSRVTIRNLRLSKPPVNAKSILQLLLCEVTKGDRVEIVTEGEDENAAAEALKNLIDSNFAGKV